MVLYSMATKKGNLAMEIVNEMFHTHPRWSRLATEAPGLVPVWKAGMFNKTMRLPKSKLEILVKMINHSKGGTHVTRSGVSLR